MAMPDAMKTHSGRRVKAPQILDVPTSERYFGCLHFAAASSSAFMDMDRNQRKLHIFSEQKGEQKILVTLQKFVI
jgi:hypothetical protein